jgi:hypothetical protein
MFTRRLRRWALGLALVLLAVAVVAWTLTPPDPANRVKAGMSLEEVNKLLGQEGYPWPLDELPGYYTCEWPMRGLCVTVLLNKKMEIVAVLRAESWTPDDSFLGRIRGWLGR